MPWTAFTSSAQGTGNTLYGNLIGTDAKGTKTIGNAKDGVYIDTDGVRIGRKGAGANVISGNQHNGILINPADSTAANVVIRGNFIGTDAKGTARIPNAGDGIFVAGGTHDTINANVIAFNGKTTPTPAVRPFLPIIVSPIGPGDGINVKGNNATGISILSNSIFSNVALGIDLGGDNAVAVNDSLDADTGPNGFQNFPVLSSAKTTGTKTAVTGILSSLASSIFRIEFFSSTAPDASGFGEGKTFLGFLLVKTKSSGKVSFSIKLPRVPTGRFLTATATAQSSGNTSEFSRAFKVK